MNTPVKWAVEGIKPWPCLSPYFNFIVRPYLTNQMFQTVKFLIFDSIFCSCYVFVDLYQRMSNKSKIWTSLDSEFLMSQRNV